MNAENKIKLTVKEANGSEIAYVARAVMESAGLDDCYQRLQAVIGHSYFVHRGGHHIAIHKNAASEERLVLIVEERA